MSSPSTHPSLVFLLDPLFVTLLSVSIHLVLVFGLFGSWVCRRIRNGAIEIEHLSKDSMVLYFRAVRLCCFLLSLYNLCIFCLNSFFWYRNGWSDDCTVTLLDLLIRSSAFLALFIYLHTQFPKSGHFRFPVLLRVWWGFYLIISCYSLVLDLFGYRSHQGSPAQLLVSDFVYLIAGFIFCYAGLFGRVVGESISLEDPLLNGDDSASVDSSNKPKGSETVTPYGSSGIFSILTFSWMSPLISTGYKKVLDLEDVPQLTGTDSANESFLVFKSSLDSVCGGSINKLTTLQLVKSLIYTTWADIVATAIFALFYTAASYVGPALIDNFVQYLHGRREYANQGYVLVCAFVGAKLVECLAQRHWFFRLQRAGIKARSVLVAMIYNKGLTLSSHSKQGHTSGEIINIMAVDAERIGDFSWYMHDPWLVVIQVMLALFVLYRNLGLASIAALVATVIVMLLNFPLSTILEKYEDQLMKCKDKRMKTTSEILKNMRILKLQGWEMKFLSKITELRESEAGWLKKFFYTKAMSTFLFWGAPTFVSVITFVACILMGIPLEAGKILSALATFRILQEPIYNLPDTISMIIQTKVSLDRMASFLRLEDLKPNVIERLPRASSEVAVEIIGGNFSWDGSSSDPTLKDINVRVYHGMKVAVCGTVGSGKSSLLSCVLGEMPKVSGTIRVSGLKAYVSQSAWIQSGKIVDNILFGNEMDRKRYDSVLEACSLKKDLEILSFGDQTAIGERGINLSGGQKQRIQIARALYQDADVYLFDDPFSAVDAHTGTHLFKECVLGHLNSKTVIYVTHQVEFLPSADLILVMRNGRISQAGKYHDILAAGSDFMELVGAHEIALSAIDSVETANYSNSTSVKENRDANALQHPDDNDTSNDRPDDIAAPEAQIVQDEEREKGKVGFPVYWKYITTANRGIIVPFILLSHISFQILQVGSNYWMAWATPMSADAQPAVPLTTLITVFIAFSIGSAVCILFRATLLATAAYKTATILFDKMHLCIFRAPMSFFDATPSGRILNRASTDQSAVDMSIPYQVGGVAFSIIQLLAIVAIMSQVAWQVFVIFIPIACVCLYYQQYYIPAARELSRLVGVCKSPVIQHFSETISGATTIRGFEQQSRFEDKSKELIDGLSRPMFHIAGAMEWLCFRLDLLSSLTFACSLIFLIYLPVGLIDPGIAGLSVTYGLNLNILQVWMIWNICELENKIISVERILQYTNIPSEPPLLVEENRPAPSWPSHGEVEIHDLQVRYAPHMPLVLRGITCTFHGGQKTGIVGRTGSGKSTLIQAIFRIVEPALGCILMDGVNISMIGLHDLRSRLSIIPQDPTMFEGTIRSNLDPLEEYTDDEIWEALDKCQLADEVRKKEGKLDSSVAENGENWSMGQRQLVCLGRVLLKKSKILVLDEATASVDTATDNLIQQTLRQHFSDSTVLIIAHRITSVLDGEMVLVLSQGLVEEYDSPARLLEDKSSSFAKLVAEYASRSKSGKRKL